MFLGHLVLGLLFVLPFVAFVIFHMRNACAHPKRRAVRIGYIRFVVSIVVLVSGFGLMRLGDRFTIKSPPVRLAVYWAHVLAPFAAVWLYVLHRLASPRIKWRIGARYGVVTAGLVGVMVWFNYQDPRRWGAVGP